MLAAKLGVRTIDLGVSHHCLWSINGANVLQNPQLSMHSVRETGGSHDVENIVKLFAGFFKHYVGTSAKIYVD